MSVVGVLLRYIDSLDTVDRKATRLPLLILERAKLGRERVYRYSTSTRRHKQQKLRAGR